MAEELGRAAFTEVLEVQVDVPLFQQGLTQLETEYKNFLARLKEQGATGQQVFDIGSLGSINSSLNQLVSSMNDIRTGFINVMTDTREQIAETLNTIDQGLKSKAIPRPRSTGNEASDAAEAAATDKRIAREEAQWERHLVRKEVAKAKYDAAIATGDEKQAEFWMGRLSRLETFEKGFRERISKSHSQWLDQQNRESEKQADRDIRRNERLEQQRNTQMERIGRLHARVLEQQEAASARHEADERARLQRMADAGRMSYNAAYNEAFKLLDEQKKQATPGPGLAGAMGIDPAKMQQGAVAVQEITQATKGLQQAEVERQRVFDVGRQSYQQAYNEAFKIKQLVSSDIGRQASQRLGLSFAQLEKGLSEGNVKIQRTFKEIETGSLKSASALDRFFGKFTGNVPELFAQILRYSLGFQLVFGVINGIQGAIRGTINAIVSSLKEGIEYQAQLQDRIADVKEALLESAVFVKRNADGSLDWATNVERAGKNAEYAALKIQEAAAKSGIPAERLEGAYKALLNANGMEVLNGDIDKGIDLATKLVSLLRSAGVPETNQRRAVTEINNLLRGQVTQKSVLRQMLNVEIDQWKEIVKKARETHDLLGQHINAHETVADRLKAAEDRLASAQNRWKDLKATLQVYANIVKGAFAEATFKVLLETLQDVRQWFNDNKPEILAIARYFGEILGHIIKITIELMKQPIVFNTIIRGVAIMASYFESMVDNAGALVAILQKMKTGDFAKAAEEYSKALERGKTREENRQKLLEGKSFVELGDNSKALEQIKDISTQLESIRKQRSTLADQDKALANSTDESSKKLSKALQEQITALNKQYRTLYDQKKKLQESLKTGTEGQPFAFEEFIDKLFGSDEKGGGKNDRVAKLRQDFQEELRGLQEGFNELQRQSDANQSNGVITARQAKDNKIAFIHQEMAAVQELQDKYVGLIKQDKTATDRAKNATIFTVNQAAGRTIERDKQAEADANNAYRRREIEADIQAARQLEQIANDTRRRRLEILKAQLDQGLMTEAEYYNEREQIIQRGYDDDVRILNMELQAAQGQEFKIAEINGRIAAIENRRTLDLQRNTEERIADMNREFRERQRLALEIEQLDADAQIESIRHKQASSGNPYTEASAERQILAIKVEQAKAAANLAVQELTAALHAGVHGKALEEFVKKAKELGLEWQKLINQQKESQETPNDTIQGTRNFPKEILGVEDWDEAKEKMGSFSGAVAMATSALKNLPGVIGGIVSAFKNGGVAAGIGATLSTVGSFIPGPVGGIMQIAGMGLSLISGLFGRAARKIGEEIKKAVKDIMTDYRDGSKNLMETIRALEQKRAEAISRLSGKKGGKKQLDEILPAIDEQLASLKKTQKEIFESFDDALGNLRIQSDVLRDVHKKWTDINKQVKEYLNAGGDAAKATEFLSLNLKNLREETMRNLRTGEQEAVQDAIALNDLLKQRLKLTEDFKKTEFDLINADSLERRAAGSVRRGQELADKRKEYQEQLDNLNSQIDLMTKRVEMEKQVFDIADDINELRRRDNELTLLELTDQLEKYKDMKTVVEGIVQGTDGIFRFTDALATLLGLTAVTPTVAPGLTLEQYVEQMQAKLGVLNVTQFQAWFKEFTEGIKQFQTTPTTVQQQQTVTVGDIIVYADSNVNGTQIGGEIAEEIYRKSRYGDLNPWGSPSYV